MIRAERHCTHVDTVLDRERIIGLIGSLEGRPGVELPQLLASLILNGVVTEEQAQQAADDLEQQFRAERAEWEAAREFARDWLERADEAELRRLRGAAQLAGGSMEFGADGMLWPADPCSDIARIAIGNLRASNEAVEAWWAAQGQDEVLSRSFASSFLSAVCEREPTREPSRR